MVAGFGIKHAGSKHRRVVLQRVECGVEGFQLIEKIQRHCDKALMAILFQREAVHGTGKFFPVAGGVVTIAGVVVNRFKHLVFEQLDQIRQMHGVTQGHPLQHIQVGQQVGGLFQTAAADLTGNRAGMSGNDRGIGNKHLLKDLQVFFQVGQP